MKLKIKTFAEFNAGQPTLAKMRATIRGLYLFAQSQRKSMVKPGNWVSFPYYHHVFDDEKAGFERQLKYLKNFGDFISLTDACFVLSSAENLKGKYFCVTFDDGYQCLYDNMMPISAAMNVPVTIYLPTDYIGLKHENEADLKIIKANLPQNPGLLSFLDWEGCRQMLPHGISFGSHTKSHIHLASIDEAKTQQELKESKIIIETELQTACVDFACPWGVNGKDFNPDITTPIAKKLGYRSFASTNRGKNSDAIDLFTLKRDHLLANWPNAQLKYFFGQ